MASFEFLAIIFTGLGLAASIVYYANILNNANKTRELQLKAQQQAAETRQTQIYMQAFQELNQEKRWKEYITDVCARELFPLNQLLSCSDPSQYIDA